MRIFSTLFFSFALALGLSAQVVLVNSPASIAGSYAFSAAQFGADLTTGVWTADVVFINDGTATPTLGCSAATNGVDLQGKIALIDRGSCEFGVKCLNAEQGGAIAAIVFNSAANAGNGTIEMGPGAVGATVTIPCVMLSYEDGQTIRAIVASGPVNMTIGNLVFPNDLSINRASIIHATNSVIPANQADALGFGINPGAAIFNAGLNTAVGAGVEATITYVDPAGGNQQVYSESDILSENLDVDSVGLVLLPSYAAAEGAGTYVVDYTIFSDSLDGNTSDDVYTTEFTLSSNVYSKARWDAANNRPRITNAYTISGGGNIEFIVGYDVPVGTGNKVDSIQFYLSSAVSFGQLGNNSVNAFLYEWDDLNADNTSTNDEIILRGICPLAFSDTSLTSQWVTLGVIDFETLEEGGYIIDGDNKRFFVGVRYEGPELVYFGFDEAVDQTVLVDNALLQSDMDYPYIGINAWANQLPDLSSGFLFTGFRGTAAQAMYVNPATSSNNEVAPAKVAVEILPNPVNTNLTIRTTMENSTKSINYAVRDNNGRLMEKLDKSLNANSDLVTFNVSEYPAGQYFVVVITDNGMKAERFTVAH